MQYVQPVGGLANDPYVDADPGTGQEGSPVPAAAIEHPMRELVALITDAGLVPSDVALDQVPTAVKTILQKAAAVSAAASGTVDAITANFVPAIAALSDHLLLIVRAGGANTSTTPTFTPASATIAAKTIVKGHNQPLVAGDISGVGFRAELQYDAALDKWVLLNPATGVNPVSAKQIQSISATVAANAMTVGLDPTSLDFRSSDLTDGAPVTRTIAAALSLVIPAGATLGSVSGQLTRVVCLAIDSPAGVELAVVNLAGGNNLDETTLISTTEISAAGTAANVIYSTTARVNVPFRLVGYIDVTEAVAGTWSSAPIAVQGQGGQAMSGMQSVGFGQTYQAATIISGAINYNTSGRTIIVIVSTVSASGGSGVVTASINDGPDIVFSTGPSLGVGAGLIPIPPGARYVLTDGPYVASRTSFVLR